MFPSFFLQRDPAHTFSCFSSLQNQMSSFCLYHQPRSFFSVYDGLTVTIWYGVRGVRDLRQVGNFE